MKVALLNAYSAHNSGDGLLVRLGIDTIRRNFGPDTTIEVVAADTDSFNDVANAAFVGAPIMSQHGLARISSALFFKRSYQAFDRVLGSCDLLVAVGGGYMRSKSAAEHLKLSLGHRQQLRLAVASGIPLVCLPQSIGPFHAEGAAFKTLYRSASTVFARDDRTHALLGGDASPNLHRAPDMAVQEVARRMLDTRFKTRNARRTVQRVCLVLRKPPAWSARVQRNYNARMRSLASRLSGYCDVIYALQSTTRGNDDLAYYRSQRIGSDYVALKDVLESDCPPDVVVSVRLHGALESLLAGVPAFHLSYERKGFGAYEDLGVADWVCNSADFEIDAVVTRIFAQDACSQFWERVGQGVAAIRQSTQRVDQTLQAAAR